jgi:hypothetical protein
MMYSFFLQLSNSKAAFSSFGNGGDGTVFHFDMSMTMEPGSQLIYLKHKFRQMQEAHENRESKFETSDAMKFALEMERDVIEKNPQVPHCPPHALVSHMLVFSFVVGRAPLHFYLPELHRVKGDGLVALARASPRPKRQLALADHEILGRGLRNRHGITVGEAAR